VKPLAVAIALALLSSGSLAQEIEFNLDNLDVSDRANIDLSQFARAGYIMPGDYDMTVHVNKSELPEMPITFLPPENDPKESVACLSPELMMQLGLKPNTLANLSYWHDGQCADLSSLEGMTVRGDLSSSTLYLAVPQAYLEYQAPDWDPPSRWDDGLPGAMFDYNVNLGYSKQARSGDVTNASGNGIAGINVGPWRLRANWQASYNQAQHGSSRSMTWNQFYAYRALKSWRAKLQVGEGFLASDLFDSVHYLGASITSDDSQLPPNLRGYAPEVSGVARSNAKVTISQQGRVLYESQVAPGPFLIQDLSDAISGTLDVRVLEQDGSEQTFQVDTASIPYLSRPGQIRYKVSGGQPIDAMRHTRGTLFQTGEFSWGISNGWSLLGGGITAGKYNAATLGVGRDLLALGAVSVNATQSRAELPRSGKLTGNSFSVSYSKRFEEYDTQVTFAGYRFSQQNYLTYGNYLDAKDRDDGLAGKGGNKQTYSITLNKQFRKLGVSLFLNYNYQTYWNKPATSRWNMSFARYFDLGCFKNLSVNLSAYRTQLRGKNDNSVYLSVSVPLGGSQTLNYSAQNGNSGSSQHVSWYDRLDDRNMYQLGASSDSGKNPGFSGFYTHVGDIAQTSTSASYQPGNYASAGFSAQGGFTATAQGAALHRINMPGGTRLMVDTEGVSGVPVQGSGAVTYTNLFGKAVIADINSYYRNQASIDINKLADNVEAERPVTQITLTEGAIGYRSFGVLKGEKLMAVIRRADGSFPPFGASVQYKGRETGIVNDNGYAWLSGVNPGVKMDVKWSGKTQCMVSLPDPLPDNELGETNLLLPCIDAVE